MKKFISGFVAGAILFGSIGVFAVGGQLIEINYGIKDIKINNVSQMPKQKPFTYNGTTFVPLRFIADKLGQPVKYDSAAQTIFIGKFDGEKEYLGSKKTHSDYEVKALSYEYSDGSKPIKDNLRNVHTQYLLLKYQPTMTEKPSGMFNFKLNKNYTKFYASIGFIEGFDGVDKPVRINIYADDKRIYAGEVERGELPADVNLDLTDVINLRIETSLDSEKASQVALFDAYLVQK